MKKNILFVCTGNTCRSPMAEAICRDLIEAREDLKAQYSVSSAGIYAYESDPASTEAIMTMKEKYGIDLFPHRAKVLDDRDIKNSYLVLTMTRHHKEMILDIYPEAADKIFTLKEFAEDEGSDPDITDPYGHDLKTYEECASEIEALIRDILEKIS